MNKKSPSQEYLDKVSPMGNALSAEESAHLRDLLIAEGQINTAVSWPDDFLEEGDEITPELRAEIEALKRIPPSIVKKTGGPSKP